jgi:hypothetical protein
LTGTALNFLLAGSGGELGEGGESVWRLGNFERGLKLEDRFLSGLPGRTPPGFHTLDRFFGGVATSLKSIDLAAKSYRSGGPLLAKLKDAINALDRFQGARLGSYAITSEEMRNARKVLQVVIPDVEMTGAQMTAFRAAREFAKNLGIDLVVTRAR